MIWPGFTIANFTGISAILFWDGWDVAVPVFKI